MKKFLTILITKLLRFAGKLIGRGSSKPGQVALKLCPELLEWNDVLVLGGLTVNGRFSLIHPTDKENLLHYFNAVFKNFKLSNLSSSRLLSTLFQSIGSLIFKMSSLNIWLLLIPNISNRESILEFLFERT